MQGKGWANDIRELENRRSKGEFPLINSWSFNNWVEVASSCGFAEILSVRPPPANWNKRWVKATRGIRSRCYNSCLFTPIKLKLSSRCHAPKKIFANPFFFPARFQRWWFEVTLRRAHSKEEFAQSARCAAFMPLWIQVNSFARRTLLCPIDRGVRGVKCACSACSAEEQSPSWLTLLFIHEKEPSEADSFVLDYL